MGFSLLPSRFDHLVFIQEPWKKKIKPYLSNAAKEFYSIRNPNKTKLPAKFDNYIQQKQLDSWVRSFE